METNITPISLDLDTVVASNTTSSSDSKLSALPTAFEGTGENGSQTTTLIPNHIYLRASCLPSDPVAFALLSRPRSTSFTYPESLPQESGMQLSQASSSSLFSSASIFTSTEINGGPPIVRPSLPTSMLFSLSSSKTDVSSTIRPQSSVGTFSSTESAISPPPKAILPATRSVTPTALPTPPATVLASNAADYFRREIDSRNGNRVDYLLRATQGFIESQSLAPQVFINLLTVWPRLAGGSGPGPISRLRRLFQGHNKIKHHFADLLYIIYFSHDVGQVARLENLKVGRGRGVSRQAVAFLKTAEALHMSVKSVKADCKKSRNYMQLLESGGPGSLLQIGTGVDAIWQHRLVKADIQVLLNYRKEHLQLLDAEAHALDVFASQLLANGMVAYGWSYNELAVTHSDLTDCLRRYINLDQLAYDEGISAVTQPLKYSVLGEGSGASDDGIEEMGQYGSDCAKRPTKQLEIAQRLEEPDISTMMQLSPTPGELDISTMMWLSPIPWEQEISTMIQQDMEPEISTVLPVQPSCELEISEMAHEQQTYNSAHSSVTTQPYGNWSLLH